MAYLGPERPYKDREPGSPTRVTPPTKEGTPEAASCLVWKAEPTGERQGCPSHSYFWNNHLVSSGTLMLPGYLLLSTSLISIIDVLLTHTDKHMSEFTHKCTFSGGSCCFLLQ